MNIIAFVLCLSFNSLKLADHFLPTITTAQGNLAEIVKRQAEKMGQAFISGDYKTYAHYTYPEIIKMMGGENKLAVQLEKVTNDMKTQGMTLSSISFDEVSKIEKEGNQLQCTIPQHTEVKLSTGRIVSTSTIIAISTDGGKNWTFVDTSNKDMSAIRKLLPNLSPAIVILPQQPPVRY